MNGQFDLNEALEQIKAGARIDGKDGVLAPLIKQLTQAALEAELESHLSTEIRNRKNGKSSKTMKSSVGEFDLDVPRDRNGSFEPQLIKKHQTHISDHIEQKILSLYALGNSYSQIAEHIEELYGVSFSKATISAVTDKVIPMLKEWQSRPLESIYPFVWLDAIHYKIKKDGRYISKAIYTILGVKLDGRKEILGLYLSESEGANFWLQVLTDLHNRDIEDILIASVDGLKGFPEAINAIYPNTEVQLCVVHQIRNSLKYVASKNQKEFMKDLKVVYQAVSKDAAELELDRLEEKWGLKYPIVIQSWRNKWENLSSYFKYPEDIRRIIYTTNIIELVHRQFRKLTKTKGAFPNENSLLKLLYVGIQNAQKKWTMPMHNWSLSISQLAIFFDGKLDKALEL
ncbi:IS256 family transposase [Sulfurovum mangrovi]|uniref:IS256 family transposase n=1 Tax=Sulfurovum mangrovi TaxID=2893889 RepID=UPI001E3D6536|nr:IS256 family transposase [Sulfurovum mangrovi]UFH58176.1 IS256 family transposase [Sulfurovum mangrovi]